MKICINEKQKQTLIATIRFDLRRIRDERDKHILSNTGSISIASRIAGEIEDLNNILIQLRN